MRKLATAISSILVLAAVTAVAGAGPATTEANGTFLMLDVDVWPPRSGHRRAPNGVGLSLNFATGNKRTGERSPYNGAFSIRLEKGFKSNAHEFPACALPKNQNEIGADRCAPAAKIGDGTGLADARPTLAEPIPLTLAAYNGEAREGRPTVVILVKGSGSVPINSEIDLELVQEKTGPFGSVLLTIPPPQGTPQNLFSISELNLTIPDRAVKRKLAKSKRRRRKGSKRTVTIHLLEAPTSCTGVWRFQQTMAAPDGASSITAADAEGCVKGRTPKRRR